MEIDPNDEKISRGARSDTILHLTAPILLRPPPDNPRMQGFVYNVRAGHLRGRSLDVTRLPTSPLVGTHHREEHHMWCDRVIAIVYRPYSKSSMVA
jgi:hypothetical protein